MNKQKVSLSSIGNLTASFIGSIQEATEFLLCCYGQQAIKSLCDARKRAWKNKVARNNSTAPKLESLPPTDQSFQENRKRAHLQAAIWRNSLGENPPEVNVLDFGWIKVTSASCLLPSTVPPGIKLVPDELLKIKRCGFASEKPCKGGHCACNKTGISCSTFCKCEGGISCCNPRDFEKS